MPKAIQQREYTHMINAGVDPNFPAYYCMLLMSKYVPPADKKNKSSQNPETVCIQSGLGCVGCFVVEQLVKDGKLKALTDSKKYTDLQTSRYIMI